MLAIFVFNAPIVYVILTNESLFLIILNCLLKTRFQQDNGVIFIEITSVCLACLSILKPNEYFPSISAPLCFLMFLFHTTCITVMHFQRSYGSRFFLPRKFRNKVYEKYLVTVSRDLRQDTFLQCIICTNSVNEPELEYSELYPEGEFVRLPKGTYIKTECGHVYHLNCLLKQLKYNFQCPYCQKHLELDIYDD